MTPTTERKAATATRLVFHRYVHDVAGSHGSDYKNLAELHEVFDQIGAEIVKLGRNRFMVIQHDEILIYGKPNP